jgi:hypothetical protein
MRTLRTTGLTRLGLLAGAALAVLLAGCDMCEEGELRCSGNVVKECSSHDWETLQDCGERACGVGRDVCHPWFDPGFGEVWCCYDAQ